jgi:hypothetical protein
MPSLELAAGRLRVRYPDSYAVVLPPTGAGGGENQPARASAWTGPVGPSDAVSAALVEAFTAQSLELVEPFELAAPTPASSSRTSPATSPATPARPGTGGPGDLQIDLDLPENEDAVILLEQDGFFSWHLPTGQDSTPRPASSRPGSPAGRGQPGAHGQAPVPTGPASRVVRFEIDVRPVAPARGGAPPPAPAPVRMSSILVTLSLVG